MRMKRSTTSIVRGNLFKLALQKKQPPTGDEEIEARNAEISDARRRLRRYIGIPLLAAMVVLAVVLLMPRDTRLEPAEGEYLLAVPVESAFLERIKAGDIVQFYAESGQIRSMRYVMVASTADDSLMVLVNELQLQDYLTSRTQDSIAILPVICGNAGAAAQAIMQQRQWNAPEITITLSDTECTLEIGQSVCLAASMTVTPEDATCPALCWESSDEAIVTVGEDGTVNAVSAGTANVTAICGDSSASCAVTVVICADALSFDAESYSTTVGQTLQLPLALQPENTTEIIRWESSDETIASVDAGGVVTAHAGGSVTITATGSRASVSCTVNISVPAESIILNSTELQLTVGGAGQLAAVVMPENASDKNVLWSSSDESIVAVGQDGTVSAVSTGTAAVTASCGDVSASCTVTVAPVTPAP